MFSWNDKEVVAVIVLKNLWQERVGAYGSAGVEVVE